MANWVDIEGVVYHRAVGGSWFTLVVDGLDAFIPTTQRRAVLEQGYLAIMHNSRSDQSWQTSVEIALEGGDSAVIDGVILWPKMADLVRRTMDGELDFEEGDRPFGGEAMTIDASAADADE